MAQTTAGNPYGLGQGRTLGAAVAAVVAFALAIAVLAGPDGIVTTDQSDASLTPTGAIEQVDDFVTRRYLSHPAGVDDSWKDDHITRRYLPGS